VRKLDEKERCFAEEPAVMVLFTKQFFSYALHTSSIEWLADSLCHCWRVFVVHNDVSACKAQLILFNFEPDMLVFRWGGRALVH